MDCFASDAMTVLSELTATRVVRHAQKVGFAARHEAG
jgi:hypothetical protein